MKCHVCACVLQFSFYLVPNFCPVVSDVVHMCGCVVHMCGCVVRMCGCAVRMCGCVVCMCGCAVRMCGCVFRMWGPLTRGSQLLCGLWVTVIIFITRAIYKIAVLSFPHPYDSTIQNLQTLSVPDTFGSPHHDWIISFGWQLWLRHVEWTVLHHLPYLTLKFICSQHLDTFSWSVWCVLYKMMCLYYNVHQHTHTHTCTHHIHPSQQ